MGSLSTAVSGLNAAQLNLYVTGHNLGNSKVQGFTRQQVMQSDFHFRAVGRNAQGLMQVGMGTNIEGIRQIRDRFLDQQFRLTMPRAHYMQVRYATGLELASIFGELEGQYRLHSVLRDLNAALHELSIEPGSLEARGNFLTFAESFIDKMNNTQRSMREYQDELNNTIKSQVQRINQLISDIDTLNRRIHLEESGGSRANDMRDWRNNAIDELSTLIEIDYTESAAGFHILTNGHLLVAPGFTTQIGLRFSAPGSNFVEPVFTQSLDILPFDPTNRNAVALFDYRRLANAYTVRNGAEQGALLGALVSRGLMPANRFSYPVMSEARVLELAFNGYTDNNGNPVLGMFQIPPAMLAAINAIDPDFATAMQDFIEEYTMYLQQPSLFLGPAATRTIPEPPSFPAFTDAQWDDMMAGMNSIQRGQALAFRDNMSHAHGILVGVQQTFFMAERNNFNMTISHIPRVQAQLDSLVNQIVNIFNQAFAPIENGELAVIAPFALGDPGQQHQHIPLFVRSAAGFSNPDDPLGRRNTIAENPFLRGSSYSIGNIAINPVLLRQGGHSLLPLSPSGDESDNTLILSIIQQWGGETITFGNERARSVDMFYRWIVEQLATETQYFGTSLDTANEEIHTLDNRRQAVSGVSIDEEMSNMIRFQHAFNAASRILNMVDSMIDTVVNRLGRVGL